MKIVFLGGGNMASALIGGLVGQWYRAADIGVIEIDAGTRQRLMDQWGEQGVRIFDQPAPSMQAAEVCVLAVKPQHMREAVQSLTPHLGQPLVVSIAAGILGKNLAQWMGTERIVRCMPNTPALIGAGITGMAALPGISEADRLTAQNILMAVGDVVWVETETQLDAVTAVSGSGPAYVFYFVEALIRAGQELGLPQDQAKQLALATFAGAARLAQHSTDPVSVLREKVTSKGGTTAAALESMASDQVAESIVKALHAAARRAQALGVEFGKS